MTTFYTVYKTTNNINNKIYIGVHRTENINDKYLGTGTLFLKALKKYGAENFTKEILFVYDNEDEMFEKEAELVTEQFVALDTNYNLDIGGRGLAGRAKDICARISLNNARFNNGKTLSDATKAKLSKAHTGKKLSEAHKRKISESLKGYKQSREHIERTTLAKIGVPRKQEHKDAMRRGFENTPNKKCEYCGKECKPAPFKRWHGDNCKHKPKELL
ncbi:homing endonuclease [Acinetobacter phage vB_AbaM_Konradin]|uniref:Putative intron endonuclease n=1 Tax=Acinetobacter phage vB_AbaM_Konradin TaxID=2666257 RepID=A0A650EUX7_9CAUD|nr:homing endonuclease [Acinetobacter phage vB_AbaM_Konradin]QGT53917.1 putative intron endonuclease [Acinetobacter phage vB_AbaM_Konradin]